MSYVSLVEHRWEKAIVAYTVSNPRPFAHFLANTIFKKLSLPNALICLTKSFPPTRPLSTARCNTYIASLHAASSAHRVHS